MTKGIKFLSLMLLLCVAQRASSSARRDRERKPPDEQKKREDCRELKPPPKIIESRQRLKEEGEVRLISSLMERNRERAHCQLSKRDFYERENCGKARHTFENEPARKMRARASECNRRDIGETMRDRKLEANLMSLALPQRGTIGRFLVGRP